MSNVGKNGANPSLCWDCENCTKPNVCSWVRDFTPVDGWRAKKTRLGGAYPMDSYLVIECPLFNRSSYGAGIATDILLIDEEGKRAEEGEICIRGTCVTMGYYNDPEKTAAAFAQNPLNSAYPEFVYRTGDVGRINERGELVFVCRKDSQIKHMGHRIELGEIESAANKCDAVRSSCCVYDNEAKRIVLFFVGEAQKDALAAALKPLFS